MISYEKFKQKCDGILSLGASVESLKIERHFKQGLAVTCELPEWVECRDGWHMCTSRHLYKTYSKGGECELKIMQHLVKFNNYLTRYKNDVPRLS